MNITDITIDREFQKLIRPLSMEEREELRVSLRRYGILSPLIVWKHEGKTILVDGHNRIELWKGMVEDEAVHEVATKELSLDTRTEVKEWILHNQLGRRNLSPDDFTLLVGRLYNQSKTTQGGDKKSKGQVDTLIDTAEKVAAKTGVSPATVKRAGKLAAKVDEIQAAQPEAPRSEVITKAKEEVRVIRVKVTPVVSPDRAVRVKVTTPAVPKSDAGTMEETKVAVTEVVAATDQELSDAVATENACRSIIAEASPALLGRIIGYVKAEIKRRAQLGGQLK